MKLRRSKKGFTIVELVIVVGVIGILSAVLIPTFVNLTKTAKESAQQLELRNAYSAYAADAADGTVFDEATGEETTTTLELLAQDKVFLYEVDTMDNTKAWEWKTDKYSKGIASGTYEKLADRKYNGYYVYKLA